VVVEDLAARAAGAGVAHHPEVVGLVAPALVVADAHDALGRQADHLVPDVVGLVVLGVDGGPQALGRQLEVDGQQLPRVLQRVVLEVVAEAEVAEHLEEGVVARGVTHVLEVVVLAAGADALLRRRRAAVGPLVEAEEDILELVHAGVGEEQRRVVAGHHGTGGDDLVPLRGEVVQEGGADRCGFHRRLSGCRIPVPAGVRTRLRCRHKGRWPGVRPAPGMNPRIVGSGAAPTRRRGQRPLHLQASDQLG
jgi:hypothetical protein